MPDAHRRQPRVRRRDERQRSLRQPRPRLIRRVQHPPAAPRGVQREPDDVVAILVRAREGNGRHAPVVFDVEHARRLPAGAGATHRAQLVIPRFSMRRQRQPPLRDGRGVKKRSGEIRDVVVDVEGAREFEASGGVRRRVHRRRARVNRQELMRLGVLRGVRREDEHEPRPRSERDAVDHHFHFAVVDGSDGNGFHLRGVASVGELGDDDAAVGGRPRDDGRTRGVGRSHREGADALGDGRGGDLFDIFGVADEEFAVLAVLAGDDEREVTHGKLGEPDEIADALVGVVVVAEGLGAEGGDGGVDGAELAGLE